MIRDSGNRGTALLGVLLTLAMLMAIAAAVGVNVSKDTQLRGAFGRSVIGHYAAEAGLNKGMGEFKNIFMAFNVPGASDFAPFSFPLGDRTVTYQLSERPGNPSILTIPSGELFGGLNVLQYNYTVTSRAHAGGDVEAEAGAVFDVGLIPLFQFAAFYNGDLEINPGPDMHLHGRVHTNGDLYLSAGTHLYVEDSPPAGVTTVQVSARGDIHRGRKDSSTCSGPVTVDTLEDLVLPTPDLDPRDLPCNGAATRVVPQAELAAWKGSMLSGITSLSVPQPDMIRKGSGDFWKKADLRIVLKLNSPDRLGSGPLLPHAIEVQDVNGNRDGGMTTRLHRFMSDEAYNAAWSSFPDTMPVFYTAVPVLPAFIAGCTCMTNPALCNSSNNGCYLPPFTNPAGSDRIYSSNMRNAAAFDDDYRRGGYFNWRERKWMTLLNINLHDLIDWSAKDAQPLVDPTDTSDGGLVIFASVEGPDSNATNSYGVRIFGSADLPIPYNPADPTGLTLVTDQALYVVGDYNRGGALPKQPAALVGDSLNVLSNAYFSTNCTVGCTRNDRQSVLNLGDANRRAASTTVNAAFLGGVDVTTPGNYNGGLENYPRFHENWSGSTFLYRGSFVSLGSPVHVNGPWCGTGGSTGGGCNIYNPPDRPWDYDADFNRAENLPPLTPRFVYVQQVLFTENFK